MLFERGLGASVSKLLIRIWTWALLLPRYKDVKSDIWNCLKLVMDKSWCGLSITSLCTSRRECNAKGGSQIAFLWKDDMGGISKEPHLCASVFHLCMSLRFLK